MNHWILSPPPQQVLPTLKRLLLIAAAFCVDLSARADTAPVVQQPNPSVARIIAPDSDGTSYGSGSLIAVNEYYGIVVTNWHVIREATGQIWVVFPGGFQSPATVMKVDRDWDLAALLIYKPNVQPLPVSTQAPLLGERLTIAGYGSGWYRAVSGRCIEYFSPGGNLPAEIVELSVPARNGDSGGPILNDRGEIAGVLFGSDRTSTMGSYCGRLRRFLAPLGADFERLSPPQTRIAAQNPKPIETLLPESQPMTIQQQAISQPRAQQATTPPPVASVAAQLPTQDAWPPTIAQNSPASAKNRENREIFVPPPAHSPTTAPKIASQNQKASIVSVETPSSAAKVEFPPVNAAIPAGEAAIPAGKIVGEKDTLFDQLKSFLAIVGLLALVIQSLKILGKAAG